MSCTGGDLGKKCSQEEVSIDLENPLVLPQNTSDILAEKIQERSDTLKKLSYISPVFSSRFTTYIENLLETS